MKRLWGTLYAKLRADVKGSLAAGGLGVAVLFVLDYLGIETSVEQKAAISTGGAWLGGKIAAYIRTESGPIVAAPTPPGFGTRSGS